MTEVFDNKLHYTKNTPSRSSKYFESSYVTVVKKKNLLKSY